MAQESKTVLFMGSLLGSAVGFLLLILTDFGGWYNYYYYYGMSEWGYVGPGSVLGFFEMVVLGLPFLYVAMISLQGVRNPNELSQATVVRAFWLAIIELCLVLFGAAAFVAAVSGSDSWWFGPGFYGALIGGILAVVCLGSVRSTYTAPGYPLAASGLYPPGAPQPYPPGYPQSAPPPPVYPPPQAHPSQSYPPPTYPSPPQTPAPAPVPPAASPTAFCPQCGSPVASGVRFCRSCGQPVA